MNLKLVDKFFRLMDFLVSRSESCNDTIRTKSRKQKFNKI